MTMQGYAESDGVHLSWEQDDYDTLAGYNVYRAESETGTPVRLNASVILPDEQTLAGKTTGSFVDTNVEAGKKYYYSFTVVPTDVGAEESKPSGSVAVTAKDTVAPVIIHTPVTTAATGSKLGISATVTDNVQVKSVTLYYRTVGESAWSKLEMTAAANNSRYTAYIPADKLSTDGLEYYITATDGVGETLALGRGADDPLRVTIQQSVDETGLGDVNGDGLITIADALMLLRAVVQLDTLTPEQFARADLNGNGKLEIAEALRVLQYVNGTVSSVRMDGATA